MFSLQHWTPLRVYASPVVMHSSNKHVAVWVNNKPGGVFVWDAALFLFNKQPVFRPVKFSCNWEKMYCAESFVWPLGGSGLSRFNDDGNARATTALNEEFVYVFKCSFFFIIHFF